MAKRQMSIHLDEDSVRIVRAYLESKGQNFSGWVNGFVMEFAKEIQGQPSPLSKPVEEMTVKEFGDVMAYWFKKVTVTEETETQEGASS